MTLHLYSLQMPSREASYIGKSLALADTVYRVEAASRGQLDAVMSTNRLPDWRLHRGRCGRRIHVRLTTCLLICQTLAHKGLD